jgi:hypothetical protein
MERSRSKLTVLDETRLRLERVQERVENQSSITTFDDWHVIGAAGEPAFQNGWTNYSLASYPAAAFWKDSAGIVHLRGLVAGSGLNTIFTLPAGFRSGPNISAGVRVNIIGVHAGGAEGRIDLYNSGEVVLAGGATAYVALADVCFRAEN